MKKLKLNTLEKKNLSSSEMKAVMGGNDCHCACPVYNTNTNMMSNWASGTNSIGDTSTMARWNKPYNEFAND